MSIQESPVTEKNSVDKVMEYIMNTPENTNPAILRGMLESLGSEGGGDGDFSTATVTINNTLEESSIGAVSVFINNDKVRTMDSVPYGTTELTIVLYKGEAEIALDADEITSTSGDLEEIEELTYSVTGDCTITGYGSHIT